MLWHRARSWTPQVTRYALVGVSNIIVFYAVFNGLLAVGLPTLAAYAIAAASSFTNSFVLNRLWTFRAKGTDGLLRQMIRFLVIACLTVAVGSAALSALLIPLDRFGLVGRNLAAFLAGIPSVVWSFTASKRWAFRPAVDGTTTVGSARPS